VIDIGFYQLAQRRPEAVLPQLVVKALAAGHRLMVRSSDAALLERLDAALWRFSPDSFVPHGLASALPPERAASQPVLLGTALPAANAADCLAQVGDDLPDDLTGLTRVLYLFESDATETARARWRIVAKTAGVRPVYWREGEGGRFEKAG
jgi:DNA polymerase-3 subunit chi